MIGTEERIAHESVTIRSNSLAFYRALIGSRQRGLKAALLRTGLSILSLPYGAAVTFRNWLFDHGWKKSYRAAGPVVSIGNLTVGGTGKTPAVEHVARFYRSLNLRVAILSRGYGQQNARNDEALLLEENLPDVPHLQGADRVELARVAVEKLESEVLVLDDGFQHRRLRRDLDVVLIDATEPWGHGWLLPRGLLREPPRSLKRAGVVLLTRCDQVPVERLEQLRTEVGALAPAVPVAESIHAPLRLINGTEETPLSLLEGREVAAFCGIGNPEAFRRTLDGLGGRVVAFEVFPDHHRYTRDDVERLRRWARQQPADGVLVTTQKDLVKLRLTQLGGRPLWAVQIALRLTAGQEALDHQLKGVLG